MSLDRFITDMPKVELHVHLEGSIQPATLLELARRNKVHLPAKNVEELRRWYRFTSFDHFVEIYRTLSRCICSTDDIEFITRKFLESQAAQQILYSEVIYTAHVHQANCGIAFPDQLSAINRAVKWAEKTLGVSMGLVVDISREAPEDIGLMAADWAIAAMDDGVVALGLGGPEVGNPPEKFARAFDRAHAAGLACVPHAGETCGPASIWGALESLHARRIGHGVRCLEDPALVTELRKRKIPLEICPTSNICLHVFPGIKNHPLPQLIEEGLHITINSDDPPMFNTSLTNEYLTIAKTFGLGIDDMRRFVLNAVDAAILTDDKKERLRTRINASAAS
jgi:adenosine deaminase